MSKPDAAPPAPVIRLARFRVDLGHVIGVGPPFERMSLIDCSQPPPQIEGWSIAIRAGVVFFVSPRGWQQGRARSECDGKGPVTVLEIPRQHFSPVWECDDPAAIDKLQRFDVPPLMRVAPSADAAKVIDSKEMGDP